eukprot:751626-Hanusia_phi.AAC.2
MSPVLTKICMKSTSESEQIAACVLHFHLGSEMPSIRQLDLTAGQSQPSRGSLDVIQRHSTFIISIQTSSPSSSSSTSLSVSPSSYLHHSH